MADNIPRYDQGEFVRVQELLIGDQIVVPVGGDWTNTYYVVALKHDVSLEVRITVGIEGDRSRHFYAPYCTLIERVSA
jgi:hypothetical protein